VLPPLASLGGVTPLVMALSIVATAAAAGLVQLALPGPAAETGENKHDLG
jgi:hypothetical protein